MLFLISASLVISLIILLIFFVIHKVKILSSIIFFIGGTIYSIPLISFLIEQLDFWGGLSGQTSMRMIFFGSTICFLGGTISLLELIVRKEYRKYSVLIICEAIWTVAAIALLFGISAYT